MKMSVMETRLTMSTIELKRLKVVELIDAKELRLAYFLEAYRGVRPKEVRRAWRVKWAPPRRLMTMTVPRT